MNSSDVLFAGNGILALSAAFELIRRSPSTRISIVGPRSRTGAGTSASGAMLNCFAEVTKYTLISEASRAKFAMCRDSLALWPTWLDRVEEAGGLPPVPTKDGTVVLENTVSGDLDSENFDAMIAAAAEFGATHEVTDPRKIAGLAPTPSARPLRALFLPDEGAVESGSFYSTLTAALVARGVAFVDGEVKALIRTADRVTGVLTADGESWSGDTVVVAAGAFTTPILDTVLDPADVQPVFAGAGISLITHRPNARPFDHVVRSVTRAGSCGLHAIPMPDGRDYVGATNLIFAEPRTRTSAGLSHFLLQCAIDQLNHSFSFAEIDEWRIGNRPVSLDTYPLLGRGPLEGLYIATGTYRDGFHNSPLIARIVADDLLGAEDRYEHPFDPTRRPIGSMSVEESVGESSYQAACTGFEASLVLPRLWRHDALPAMFIPGMARMYEDLGVRFGFSPDIVPFLVSGAFSETGSDREAYLRVKSLLQPGQAV
ncbi:FAD-dependent oxidoreductase [Streptosporangium sp. NPDC023615]|uniref:NAD(P)/FAD-dependent oxidoreductase n=1 Tax=Streptosporangium sp. NPDC023615 TaxID=3154794 RepID=UPI00341F5357